jgi:3-O-methylgallate 3,4-dioxygenase
MNDNVMPNVPLFINTFYPPNQPTFKRCYEFGKALRRTIESWDTDKTVAVIASGGLSHYVIEEDLDREGLDIMAKKDEKALLSLPAERFQSGTSEFRNWVVTAGAMAEASSKMNLIDYVPCYRSVAGTGCAMAFAHWS